jgi:fatty-acyl-CoA synthase
MSCSPSPPCSTPIVGGPYGAVMTGADLVMPGPHLHAEDLLDLIAQTQPTLSLGVPTIWLSLIQAIEQKPGRWSLPKGMRSIVGGSAAPESLIRAFARHGVDLVQGWGMTETSPLCTISYLKPELENASEDEIFRLRATAGVPVAMVDMRIMGERGQAALGRQKRWRSAGPRALYHRQLS